ncbi:MAG: response regulator, partial [Planctomycetes bacterium]|nr:response regulator [Planctomycetota bacterium]
FSGLANEIQAPLEAAVAMAGLVLAEPIPPRAAELARDLKATVAAALNTVNDVLDLSKIKAGNLTLVIADYDFINLLRGVRSTAFFQAKEKGLNFKFRVDPALPRCLKGDVSRLRQILQNIIGNAIQSTDSGSVTVRVSRDGEFIRVDVADTGAGVDAEDLDILFSPFHNPYGQSGAAGKNAGLGLAVAKSLVDMMGGSVIVDSEPGAGSRFHLHLPLVPGDPAAVPQAVRAGEKSRPRLLLVDDNQTNRKHAGLALKAMGYDCDTAASGPEAVEMVRAIDYDLVLMDYAMPGMNGSEATRAIRDMGKTALPIIGLTTNNKPENVRQYLSEGMNDILAKPVKDVQLRELLAKWLGSPLALPRKDATSIMSMSSVSLAGQPGYGAVEMAGNIPGLDVDAGLANVGGQYGMYEDLLNLAGESLPGLVENLRQAIRDGDADRLLIELNGLEESLHTIGMVGLSEQARQCETDLGNTGLEGCAEKLMAFLRALNIFANQLQGLFENGANSSSVIYGDRLALEKRLHKILHEMKLGNHVEVRRLILKVSKRSYDGVSKLELLEIKRLVNSAEYRSAAARLSEVLGRLASA